MSESKPLAGRVAVVTGAARGIGREVALRCARNGAAVVVNYLSNAAAASDVVAAIQSEGGEAISVQADVSRRADVQRLVAGTIRGFGRVDLLVNNAGYLRQLPYRDISDEEWDRTIDVNLKSVFLCTQEFAPHLAEGPGVVVNITSVGGQKGGDKAPHYAAAKAGVISLTKSFARLLAPSGVRVNAVAPGFIKTDMYEDIIKRQPVSAINAEILLGRAGEVSEVADCVVFLFSNAASYVTGHVLNVNGGLYLGAGS